MHVANEEAAKRTAASDHSGAEGGEPEQQARLLRVRVLEGGRPTVDIKVPIGVAKWGMKMAQAFRRR